MKHVVLGGSGCVGAATVAALVERGVDVVSVARSAQQERRGVQNVKADLLDADSTRAAIASAAVVYLTAAVPYSTRAWREQWPTIMRNTIAACLEADAPLVFLDNVYAYGPVDGPMVESDEYRPTTRKGRLRHELLRMLENSVPRGLRYSIVRSADFYGPGASTSVFTTMMVDNVVAGKPPVWMFDATKPHSMTFVPDLGRSLAAVGTAWTTTTSNGQVWHAPTDSPPLTGEQYARLLTGAEGRVRTMSALSMRIGGLFIPVARESLELSYQSTRDYVFDSSRFEKEFGIAPTAYADGITATLQHARENAVR